jgi:hypothetical protein
MARKSVEELKAEAEARAKSEEAVLQAQRDLQLGQREGGLNAHQRRSSENVVIDEQLAKLTQNLYQANLDSEASADMSDAEYARQLQQQEEDLAQQEAADAEYARKLAAAERTGTTGALEEARVKKLQPQQQRGGRGGSDSPSLSDEADC